jgi:hypothetical protein
MIVVYPPRVFERFSRALYYVTIGTNYRGVHHSSSTFNGKIYGRYDTSAQDVC